MNGFRIGGIEILTEPTVNHRFRQITTIVYMKDDKGLCVIDSKLKGLEKGDIIILPSGINYSFRKEDLGDDYNKNVDAVVIRFDRHWLDGILSIFPSTNEAAMNIREIKKPMTVIGPKWLKMSSLMDSMTKMRKVVDPSKIMEFLNLLSTKNDLREFICAETKETTLPEERREKIENYIECNLGRKVKLDEVADQIGLSRLYFSLLFKKTFKERFADYINRKRIEKACRLLSSSVLPMEQIADNCGFKTVQYFNRAFKKVCGQTPGEYRKNTAKVH